MNETRIIRFLWLVTLNHMTDKEKLEMKHVSELNLQYLNKELWNMCEVLISMRE